MKRKMLGRAPNLKSSAMQVKALSLKVGDVIIGRQSSLNDSWSETKLKILWVGEDVAVFEEWNRCSEYRCWRRYGERADWQLDCRDWEIVET